ncbi:hypothetical protein HPB50_012514 [Hyalomma asiaticum]|uniref:Uncharacterized protein n=1 Tax=Hyalomma asiaticum TaxID=266040 RepID=A0ACB7SLE7_HYAAI|nr:hypothetical protein HPB50_012514 [Hyalomma asiaticum]
MSTLAADEASDLKQDLETVARLELGETPEVKRDSLAELHRLLEEDDELRVPPDDEFLLMFLRTRKYNVSEALERIKRYFRARKKMPEYFEELTTSCALYETVFREHKLIMYAGERDPMGRVASVTNYGAWNSNICSITELLRCGLWAMECSLLEEETQIRGFVAAIDLKGFSTHHLMQMTPWFLARVISIAQNTSTHQPPEYSGNDNVRFLPTFRQGRNDRELFLVTLLVCSGAVFVFFKVYGRDACLPKQGKHRLQNLTDIEGRPKSFYDTDGISGYNYDIVPDIIHLVRYNQPELTFIDVVCLRSMYLNHRPAKIYVHCDQCGFTGNYTRLVEGIKFTFINTVFPKEVFGIKIEVKEFSSITQWHLYRRHSSKIATGKIDAAMSSLAQ